MRVFSYRPPKPDHRAIAERWAKQYQRSNFWKRIEDPRGSEAIHAELVALGPDPRARDIDRIIGNDSWTL